MQSVDSSELNVCNLTVCLTFSRARCMLCDLSESISKAAAAEQQPALALRCCSLFGSFGSTAARCWYKHAVTGQRNSRSVDFSCCIRHANFVQNSRTPKNSSGFQPPGIGHSLVTPVLVPGYRYTQVRRTLEAQRLGGLEMLGVQHCKGFRVKKLSR